MGWEKYEMKWYGKKVSSSFQNEYTECRTKYKGINERRTKKQRAINCIDSMRVLILPFEYQTFNIRRDIGATR